VLGLYLSKLVSIWYIPCLVVTSLHDSLFTQLECLRLICIYIQVTALSNIEAKKRFEFLEAVSGTMDAHLRYFKQVHPCHYFHIDISRSCTHVIQTFSVAFSLGI
jgi:hypothetical protein